jgi:hypothetical protein
MTARRPMAVTPVPRGLAARTWAARPPAARRPMAGVAAALAALALMAGCASPAPAIRPDPSPAEPAPAVLPVQTGRILTELAGELSQADQDWSVDGLKRLGGSAVLMRRSEYTMRRADEKAVPEPFGTEFAGTIVAATEAWPRSFIAVTEPAATGAQFMYVLTQADPRSDYQMTSWVRLVAPVTLPTTAPPETGSPALALDAPDLSATPAAALESYAAAKADPDGEAAGEFGGEPDPARQAWTSLVLTWTQALAQLDPTVSQTATVAAGSGLAVQTADGGAIVFGEIDSSLSLAFTRANSAQSFTLPPRWAALGAATAQVTQSAQIDFLQTVALAIPPASSGEPITVLGVAEAPVSVAAQ